MREFEPPAWLNEPPPPDFPDAYEQFVPTRRPKAEAPEDIANPLQLNEKPATGPARRALIAEEEKPASRAGINGARWELGGNRREIKLVAGKRREMAHG